MKLYKGQSVEGFYDIQNTDSFIRGKKEDISDGKIRVLDGLWTIQERKVRQVVVGVLSKNGDCIEVNTFVGLKRRNNEIQEDGRETD